MKSYYFGAIVGALVTTAVFLTTGHGSLQTALIHNAIFCTTMCVLLYRAEN